MFVHRPKLRHPVKYIQWITHGKYIDVEHERTLCCLQVRVMIGSVICSQLNEWLFYNIDMQVYLVLVWSFHFTDEYKSRAGHISQFASILPTGISVDNIIARIHNLCSIADGRSDTLPGSSGFTFVIICDALILYGVYIHLCCTQLHELFS